MRTFFILLALVFFLIVSPFPLFAGGGSEPEENHWARPFKVSGGGVDTDPKSCKACHAAQYDGWSSSLHSEAMSPGLLMQIGPDVAPAFVKSCKFCHAPAIEQSEVIERGESDGESRTITADITNPSYDESLNATGVSCAICHVREGVVNGPLNPTNISGEPPHKTKTNPLFTSAEFCAACHQMDRGYELNGKLLTNTYAEWKESYYGRNNITCQNCHMPERSHDFRGIHDPDMVRKGLGIKLLRVPTFNSKGVKAALSIKNARVGHMFPTYVTPLVVVKAFLEDKDGEVIEDSVERGFIGRLISQDLSTEYFDTRLAPFQSYVLEYDTTGRDIENAKKLVFEITVRPDEFYDRMYKRAIEHGSAGFVDEHLLEAESRSDNSSYTIFREEILIGD